MKSSELPDPKWPVDVSHVKLGNISFTGPGMANALWTGLKTQTRRLVAWESINRPSSTVEKVEVPLGEFFKVASESKVFNITCPYGSRGSLLYVKESFAFDESDYTDEDFVEGNPEASVRSSFYRWVHYRDTPHIGIRIQPDFAKMRYLHESQPNSATRIKKWSPAFFMPYAAARMLIKVSDVRIERVQEITEEDAEREGVWISSHGMAGDVWLNCPTPGEDTRDPRVAYRALFEKINGPAEWQANPHVWVVTFDVLRRVG